MTSISAPIIQEERRRYDSAYEFACEEAARGDEARRKDREDRDFEIEYGHVWMLGYTCAQCGNHLMWNGSSTEPYVHCPRCHVRVTKVGLAKMFPEATV